MRELPSSSLSTADAYALLTSMIVPRPIAWVTTSQWVLAQRHINVAPFSFFNGLCSDPPMITLAIAARADGTDKDTLRWLRRTRACCVHVVEEEHLDGMHQTSAELPEHESELPLSGLGTTACMAIDGVRLAGVRAGLECKLLDVHRYGRARAVSLVVLEVVHAFVDEELLNNERRIEPHALRTVARRGGTLYQTGGEHHTRTRPGR
jgi:flavin reductase (DIM6/NTAB) family NADH-FMN oxidoreductase RutF